MNDDRRQPSPAATASAPMTDPLHDSTAYLSAQMPTSSGGMTTAEFAASAQFGGSRTAVANAAPENAAAVLISSSPSSHGFLRPTPGLDRATFPHWMLGSATAAPPGDHNRGVAASYSTSSGHVVPPPATAAAAARDPTLAASGAAALPLAPFASAMDALRATDDVDTMMKAESDADVASGDNSGGACSDDEEDDGNEGGEAHGGQEGQAKHAGDGGHGGSDRGHGGSDRGHGGSDRGHGGSDRGHGAQEEKAGEEGKGREEPGQQEIPAQQQQQNQRGPQRPSRGTARVGSGPHPTRCVVRCCLY
ncbi:unnamed protein product [Closterium sp. Yama58-4]|nr:unnamed protein product [Closterium sp. Yama58-4]